MIWELEIASGAKQEMHRLSDDTLIRMNDKILELMQNPFPSGVRKLRDGSGYRVRVGVWRILYDIDKKEHRIVIFAVGHRSKVYK